MIKVFEETSAERIEKSVNDFMKKVGYNCAVRDHMVVLPNGQIVWGACVFWDGDKEEVVNETSEPTKAGNNEDGPKDIGALWVQKSGKIKGNWKGKEVTLSQEEGETLLENGFMDMKLGDDAVHIITSKYKKTAKHPDYIILPSKG
jgi:hypothetical protein